MAADASAATASRLIDRIMDVRSSLCAFPDAGAARDHLAPGLRVTFRANYAIYYVHTETEVVIVRVLHGARDASALAERGGFG